MSSLLDVRLGAQEPVIQHLPPDVHSLAAAQEAIELADAYGVCDGYPLSESQRVTLRAALGERADGSWAASRVGDFGPRQGTGKSDKIAARELAGLILFGEQLIIHTAHEFPTANESFLRLVAVFDNWDDLRKRVRRIRYANGEQGIELMSGQRLKYRARTGGSGRGFAKADLVVYDEAQHLSREHVAASGPAKLANPNSQTWYAGSGGMSTSAVAWALRRDAVLGRGGRLAYTEATAEIVTAVNGQVITERPDPTDLDAWYRSIPGLGRWVTEESVRALFDELGPELFGRECLCAWDPEPSAEGAGAFDANRWASLADPQAERGSAQVFGVATAPDRSWSAVGVAWLRPNGARQVMLADYRPGAAWVPGRVAELRKQWGGTVLAEMADTASRGLIAEAEELSQAQQAQAHNALADAVEAGSVRHGNEPALNTAVRAARWRPSGDSRVLDRKGSADISPLVAVALALHGLLSWPADVPAPVAVTATTETSDLSSMQF
jgi:hypothetical protein